MIENKRFSDEDMEYVCRLIDSYFAFNGCWGHYEVPRNGDVE